MSKVVDEWSLMFFTGAELHYKDTEKGNEWGDFGGLFLSGGMHERAKEKKRQIVLWLYGD